nr:IS630 family transposase [Nannocystis pusilla]
MVQRARIVLLAAQGLPNAEIARRVGCHVDTVRQWRQRFAEDGRVSTLADLPRSGRPARVSAATRCELIKLACDKPENHGVKHQTTWTYGALAKVLLRETGVKLSVSEVGRILRNEDFRPHKMRLWLHSPDPEFCPKVQHICDLYHHPPDEAHVICVDEKTGMQALGRRFPTKLPAPGRAGRFEFEYIRRGTWCLFGAFDVRTGELFGECKAGREAKDLVAFMEGLARKYPTGDVYVVWDNLNIHYDGREERWARFNKRHGGRFHFVYTPLHASWVNQIEIWFSLLQRRVLRHADFPDADALLRAVRGFIRHWNRKEAHPFNWTFRGHFVQNERRLAS